MNTVVQSSTYDATGQQATATYGASWLQQWYDAMGCERREITNQQKQNKSDQGGQKTEL
jgi:hypothetical protein